jgi:hypothetical protein
LPSREKLRRGPFVMLVPGPVPSPLLLFGLLRVFPPTETDRQGRGKKRKEAPNREERAYRHIL